SSVASSKAEEDDEVARRLVRVTVRLRHERTILVLYFLSGTFVEKKKELGGLKKF
ncbi:hypothetical protein TorRG33x02_075130, partial [Trema orientale]